MYPAFIFRFCEPCCRQTSRDHGLETAKPTADKEKANKRSILLAGTRTMTEVRNENGDADPADETYNALP